MKHFFGSQKTEKRKKSCSDDTDCDFYEEIEEVISEDDRSKEKVFLK